MAVDVGVGFVDILPRTDQFAAKLRSELTAVFKAPSIGSAFDALGNVITAHVPTITAAFATLTAKVGVDAVKAFQESQNVMTQTAAVLSSTGHAAGLTSDQIAGLAKSLELNTTYSDEAVQSAENLLLTFTNIGGDVFPRATRAVTDMATALGRDLPGTARIVGRALQDPIHGLTMLTRVGVTFSDDQKAVIERLVETGHTAKAQGIILDELTKKFGGSAAAAATTFAGKIEQLKNQIDDQQELIGAQLVPSLDRLLDTIKPLIPAVGQQLVQSFKALGGVIDIVVAGVDLLNGKLPTLTSNSAAFFQSVLSHAPGMGIAADFLGKMNEKFAELDARLHPGTKALEEFEVAQVKVAKMFDKIYPKTNSQGQALIGLAARIAKANGMGGLFADTLRRLGLEHDRAAEAAHRQLIAEHLLNGGFISLASAAAQYKTDIAAVNKLEDKGKTGTKAYADAVLQAAQSKLSLNQAMRDELGNLKKSGQSFDDARDKVYRFGHQMGLTDSQIKTVFGPTLDRLKGKYDALPDNVVTHVKADTRQAESALGMYASHLTALAGKTITTFVNQVISQTGGHAAGGILFGANGFIAQGPTAIVGEGRYSTFAGPGAEAAIPLNDRGIDILAEALSRAGGRRGGHIDGRLVMADWRSGIGGLSAELAWEDAFRNR